MRYHLDEHVDPAIANGLRRRGIDVVTTVEASLLGATDEAQLASARASGRVIFTQDQDFLVLATSGVPHAGIVYCKQGSRSIGQIIDHLEMIHLCLTEAEMRDHVEFV